MRIGLDEGMRAEAKGWTKLLIKQAASALPLSREGHVLFRVSGLTLAVD